MLILISLLPFSSYAVQYFGQSTIQTVSGGLLYDIYDYYQLLPYYDNITKNDTLVIGMDDQFTGDMLHIGLSKQFGTIVPSLIFIYDANGTCGSRSYRQEDINGKFLKASDFDTDPNDANNAIYGSQLAVGMQAAGLLIAASYGLRIDNNSSEFFNEQTISDKSNGSTLYTRSKFETDSQSDFGTIRHIITLGTKVGFLLPQLQMALTTVNGDSEVNYSKNITETYYVGVSGTSNTVLQRITSETKGLNGGAGTNINGSALRHTDFDLEFFLQADLNDTSLKCKPELTIGIGSTSVSEDDLVYETSTLLETFDNGVSRIDTKFETINEYTYEQESDSSFSATLRVYKDIKLSDNSMLLLGPSYGLTLSGNKYNVTYEQTVYQMVDNNNDGDFIDAGDVNLTTVSTGDEDWVETFTMSHNITLPLAISIKPRENLHFIFGSIINLMMSKIETESEDVQGFTKSTTTDNNNAGASPVVTTNVTYTITDNKKTCSSSLSKNFTFGVTWEFTKNYFLNFRSVNSGALLNIRDWAVELVGRF